MATRRLRIKAVANLPARRNRPAASHSSEVENKVTSVRDLIDLVSVDDISNQQKIEAVNSVPPAPEKKRVLDSTSPAPVADLPTRKSVIVSAEEATRNDFQCASDTTKEKEFNSTTRENIKVDILTLASSVPKANEVNKTNNRFDNNESTTTSATTVATVTVTNSISEKADLSDVGDPSQTQHNTRGPLRGRRLKPAVNLPAANRKRAVGAGDCSTPVPSSTCSKLRLQEVSRTNEDDATVEVNKQQAVLPKEEHPDHGLTQFEVQLQLSSPPQEVANRSSTNSAPDDTMKECGPSTTTSTSSSSGRRRQTSISQKAAVARRNFIKHLSKDSPPQRSSLTMFDLIFYNPSSNPMKTDGTCTPKGRRRSRETSVCSVASLQEDRLREENVDDVENSSPVEEETAMPVPRVKVGPDGNLILDEQSLVIETTGTKKTREELERSEVVVDTGGGGHYKRTKRSKDWSDQETKKFYRALHVVGTDFSLMQPLFRSRTRRELKLKFKKEERLNPSLVNKALAQPLDFDISELEREVALEEEEQERLLAEESQKNLEPSCSANVKVIQRPKQPKKKQSKSSRKSFSSSEICEDEPEEPPLVQVEGDANKITKSVHTKTPKPKTNTIYVENEAEADYTMLSLGIVSPAVKVDSSAVKNPKRTKAKPKLPAAKRLKENECHEEVPSCSYKHINTSVTPNNNACVRPAGRVTVTPSSALPALSPTTPVSGTSTTRVVSCSSSRLLPTTPTLPRMEPGSIIVLKSPYPQHPDRHILQVYMVTNSSGNNAVPTGTPTSTVPLSQLPGISPLPPPVPSLVPVTPRSSNPPSTHASDSPEKVLTCL